MIGAGSGFDELVRRRFASDPDALDDPEATLARIVHDELPLLAPDEATAVVRRLVADLVGLGPLDALLADDSVTDVLVNGSGPVWVERAGRLERTAVELDARTVELLVERAFHRNGRSVDRARPIGDTRLPDGTRLSVVLPPAAVDGTVLALRRFRSAAGRHLEDFGGTAVAQLLRSIVARRDNVVVFGPTGSGKTSLLNVLATVVDPNERIVTIEDAAELRLRRPHVVRLEGRPDNGDGVGRIDLRTLVRAALRLRPDRIVVGEVRGPEALDMVWALATGHRGSLSTCHARSATDALARLETFVLLADAALPLAAVRAQVRAAVDVLVGVERVGPHRMVVSVDRVVVDPRHPTGVQPVVPHPIGPGGPV